VTRPDRSFRLGKKIESAGKGTLNLPGGLSFSEGVFDCRRQPDLIREVPVGLGVLVCEMLRI